jgi:DNA repair exonuclease SbcCD ATPase subunit
LYSLVGKKLDEVLERCCMDKKQKVKEKSFSSKERASDKRENWGARVTRLEKNLKTQVKRLNGNLRTQEDEIQKLAWSRVEKARELRELGEQLKTQQEEIARLLVEFRVAKVKELGEQLKTQQEEMAKLHSQLAELQTRYDYEKKVRSNRIFGVTVMKRKFKMGGRSYEKWVGFFRRNGKQHWIYIGGDPRKAEEKIKAWLKRKGFWKFMGKGA